MPIGGKLVLKGALQGRSSRQSSQRAGHVHAGSGRRRAAQRSAAQRAAPPLPPSAGGEALGGGVDKKKKKKKAKLPEAEEAPAAEGGKQADEGGVTVTGAPPPGTPLLGTPRAPARGDAHPAPHDWPLQASPTRSWTPPPSTCSQARRTRRSLTWS
jgi:hypothetical protein